MQQNGSDRNWNAIACGAEHVLALKSDGTLWAWGGDLRRPMNKHLQKLQTWLLKLGINDAWLNPKLLRPVQLLGP
jgi:alpha-tubulin suppressor-like RCC1 family protein